MKSLSVKVIVLTLCSLAVNATASAQVADIFEQTTRATAWVVNEQDQVAGTAVIVDTDGGFLLTAKHVVAAAGEVILFFPAYDDSGQLIVDPSYYLNKENLENLAARGLVVVARVIAADEGLDLALLQVPRLPDGVRAVELASTEPAENEDVFIVGHPADRPLWSYTLGKVRAVADANVTYANNGQHVQAHVVSIYGMSWGGNSGGPVVNSDGELIGIVSASDHRLSTTAISVTELPKLLEAVRSAAVFSVSNPTERTLRFAVRWSQNDAWETITLEPGQSTHFWKWNPAAETAPEVQFDSSFEEGFQARRIRLQYQVVLRGVNPTAADAKPYEFVFIEPQQVELYTVSL